VKYVITNLTLKIQLEYIVINCYQCSVDSTRHDNTTRKHQKTLLRRSMKIQAIKLLGDKCCLCGYNRCIDALEFHHENPNEKTI